MNNFLGRTTMSAVTVGSHTALPDDITANIPKDEVKSLSTTLLDRNGRLFEWEGRLYRAITQQNSALYRRLFNEEIIERLVRKKLLVPSEPTGYYLEGFDFVVKHKRLPYISYAYEWSAEMLRDAALMVLDLNLELFSLGLTTQDAHSLNVLFDYRTPLFVDLTSIVELPDNKLWPPFNEFCRFFLLPLQLYSMGQHRITRALLRDFDRGVEKKDFAAIRSNVNGAGNSLQIIKDNTSESVHQALSALYGHLPHVVRRQYRRIRNYWVESAAQKNAKSPTAEQRIRFLKKLRQDIEVLELPAKSTKWANYYGNHFPDFHDPVSWTIKQRGVNEVLEWIAPETVLDIGSNRGWYSQLAAKKGISCVAFDTDETSINDLYMDAKADKLNILPLIIDITNPSPGYGLQNSWLPAAVDRFQGDLVLVLALVHHLVFKKALDFPQIVRALVPLVREWLLIEFVPPEDRFVTEWYSDYYRWYTLNNFISVLSLYFDVVKTMDSHESPRILLLCRKLRNDVDVY